MEEGQYQPVAARRGHYVYMTFRRESVEVR